MSILMALSPLGALSPSIHFSRMSQPRSGYMRGLLATAVHQWPMHFLQSQIHRSKHCVLRTGTKSMSRTYLMRGHFRHNTRRSYEKAKMATRFYRTGLPLVIPCQLWDESGRRSASESLADRSLGAINRVPAQENLCEFLLHSPFDQGVELCV